MLVYFFEWLLDHIINSDYEYCFYCDELYLLYFRCYYVGVFMNMM